MLVPKFDVQFLAKIMLAVTLLTSLIRVVGSQIFHKAPLSLILLYGALGVIVFLLIISIITLASLSFWQFVLRKGGTDVQWLWFSSEPPGLKAMRQQAHDHEKQADE